MPDRRVSAAALLLLGIGGILPAAVPPPAGPPLPNAVAEWHADPWRPVGGTTDELLVRQDDGGARLGPFVPRGGSLLVVVKNRARDAAAILRHGDGETPDARLPIQRLFRRVVIGPIRLPATADADAGHAWVLVRQGRVRLQVRGGEPQYLEDELAFDLRFDAIDLADLTPAQRAAWIERFWATEARMWEAAARGRPSGGPAAPPPAR